MIRRQEGNDFLLITQHDHALLAGELAEHFGNEFFATPDPRESAIKGVSLHDCGWPLHDNDPTLNKSSLPLDVFESSREIALQVWTASVEGAAARDGYAGLLVSLHVLSLSVFASTQTDFQHEKFDLDNPPDRFAVTRFQQREIERQEKLRMTLGLRTERASHHKLPTDAAQKKEDQLTFNFRMLQAMDVISLAACCTKPPSKQTQDVMPQPGGAPFKLDLARDGNDVRVDPWPFDQAEIELMIPVCRIAGKKYANVDELRAAYNAGSNEIITSRVTPPPHA